MKRYIDEYPKEVPQMAAQNFVSKIESTADEVKLFENLALYKKSESWLKGMIPSAFNFIETGLWEVPPKDYRKALVPQTMTPLFDPAKDRE